MSLFSQFSSRALQALGNIGIGDGATVGDAFREIPGVVKRPFSKEFAPNVAKLGYEKLGEVGLAAERGIQTAVSDVQQYGAPTRAERADTAVATAQTLGQGLLAGMSIIGKSAMQAMNVPIPTSQASQALERKYLGQETDAAIQRNVREAYAGAENMGATPFEAVLAGLAAGIGRTVIESPVGGPKGLKSIKFLDDIARATPKQAEKLLIKQGVSKTVAREYAQQLGKVSTRKAVAPILKEVEQVSITRKMLQEAAPDAPQATLRRASTQIAKMSTPDEITSAVSKFKRDLEAPLVTKARRVDEPLITEAKKYKTADEFVEAYRADKVFHGTDNIGSIGLKDSVLKRGFEQGTGKKSVYSKPIFFTENRRYAKVYGRDLFEYEIPKDFKVLDVLNKKQADDFISNATDKRQARIIVDGAVEQYKDGYDTWSYLDDSTFLDFIKEEGYDVLRMVERRAGDDIRDVTGEVFKKDVYSNAILSADELPVKLSKTKAQLKDIYTKATDRAKPSSRSLSRKGTEKTVQKKSTVKQQPKKPSQKTSTLADEKDNILPAYKRTITDKAKDGKKISTARQQANEGILDDYKISEEYKVAHMDKEIEKAVDLIKKDKDEAMAIATGAKKSNDHTMMATNFVMKEKAIQEGNWALVNKLMTQAYETGTRMGQEIAMMKANITQNPHEIMIKRIVETRMNQMKMGTPELRAEKVAILTTRIKADVKKIMKSKYKKAESANAFLASITC